MPPSSSYPVHTALQLSAHLKALRKSRRLTQADLGRQLGVVQSRVAEIERNPGAVSVNQLLAVLHALEARLVLAEASTLYPAGGKDGKATW